MGDTALAPNCLGLNFRLNKFITGLEIVANDPLTNTTSSSDTYKVDVDGESKENSIVSQIAHPGALHETQALSSQAATSYKEKLYKETIELMTEGVFSLAQLCKVVSILSRFQIFEDPVGPASKHHRQADKIWAGM